MPLQHLPSIWDTPPDRGKSPVPWSTRAQEDSQVLALVPRFLLSDEPGLPRPVALPVDSPHLGPCANPARIYPMTADAPSGAGFSSAKRVTSNFSTRSSNFSDGTSLSARYSLHPSVDTQTDRFATSSGYSDAYDIQTSDVQEQPSPSRMLLFYVHKASADSYQRLLDFCQSIGDCKTRPSSCGRGVLLIYLDLRDATRAYDFFNKIGSLRMVDYIPAYMFQTLLIKPDFNTKLYMRPEVLVVVLPRPEISQDILSAEVYSLLTQYGTLRSFDVVPPLLQFSPCLTFICDFNNIRDALACVAAGKVRTSTGHSMRFTFIHGSSDWLRGESFARTTSRNIETSDWQHPGKTEPLETENATLSTFGDCPSITGNMQSLNDDRDVTVKTRSTDLHKVEAKQKLTQPTVPGKPDENLPSGGAWMRGPPLKSTGLETAAPRASRLLEGANDPVNGTLDTGCQDGEPPFAKAPLGVITRAKVPPSNQVNLERIRLGLDDRTTLMLRNIPNKVDQQLLQDYVDATNKNTYDFLYLRIDFSNKCNVGYAFISFIKPEHIITFAQARAGTKWNRFNSEKICDMSYANIQGKKSLVEKFRNSSVMDQTYRPIIFHTQGDKAGDREEFPAPNNIGRKLRSQASISKVGLFPPQDRNKRIY